jgi:hypothetical protein
MMITRILNRLIRERAAADKRPVSSTYSTKQGDAAAEGTKQESDTYRDRHIRGFNTRDNKFSTEAATGLIV